MSFQAFFSIFETQFEFLLQKEMKKAKNSHVTIQFVFFGHI